MTLVVEEVGILIATILLIFIKTDSLREHVGMLIIWTLSGVIILQTIIEIIHLILNILQKYRRCNKVSQVYEVQNISSHAITSLPSQLDESNNVTIQEEQRQEELNEEAEDIHEIALGEELKDMIEK